MRVSLRYALCPAVQALIHYDWSTTARDLSAPPSPRVYFFRSPIKDDEAVCNQTLANVIKKALIDSGIPSNVALHLARRLRTELLQGSKDVSLAELASAMRWKSILGAASTYFNVC